MSFLLNNIQSLSVLATITIATLYFCLQHLSRKKKKEDSINTFNETINKLSSTNKESQLSAAILMRRFFEHKYLRQHTIEVISSLLRVLPTGIYQKTLGDGLATAQDLSAQDFQKTNFQNILLTNKQVCLNLNCADFWQSDLSYALIVNVCAQRTVFYNAVLLSTRIKDSDLCYANFADADLTNAYFQNVILKGANFSGAINIPEEIEKTLVNGICESPDPITTISRATKKKKIFFSMPGTMRIEDELLVKEYKRMLEKRGYCVIYYIKDDYPKFGQFNKIRESILLSDGMIAFGFKQIDIQNGVQYPSTKKEKELKDLSLATPWNNIEVGMGLLKGLPILLVSEKSIKDGVFDHNLNECFIGKITAETDVRFIEKNSEFRKWLELL